MTPYARRDRALRDLGSSLAHLSSSTIALELLDLQTRRSHIRLKYRKEQLWSGTAYGLSRTVSVAVVTEPMGEIRMDIFTDFEAAVIGWMRRDVRFRGIRNETQLHLPLQRTSRGWASAR